jgi:CRISPR system Cascade subunit CasC
MTTVNVHILHPYIVANLNRSEGGGAKVARIGSAKRTIVSSQSEKRRIRMSTSPTAVRTRRLPAELRKALIASGMSHDEALGSAVVLCATFLGKSTIVDALRKKAAKKTADPFCTAEMVLVDRDAIEEAAAWWTAEVASRPETAKIVTATTKVLSGDPKDYLDGLKKIAPPADKELVAGLRKVLLRTSQEIALVGSFLPSASHAVEATLHVAHSFSVTRHAEYQDYFVAVDDISGDASGDSDGDENTDGNGAAHLGLRSLTSPLLYRYASFDVTTFLANLDLDITDDEAKPAVRHAVNRIISGLLTNPSQMKSSTAPYTPPVLVLVEVADFPMNAGVAYFEPVEPLPHHGRTNITELAVERLGEWWGKYRRGSMQVTNVVGFSPMYAETFDAALNAAGGKPGMWVDDDIALVSESISMALDALDGQTV